MTDAVVTDAVVTDGAPSDQTDRHVDRCVHVDFRTDRCHVVDRPHDIDYRALIIRLIEAHEWQKLLRLLHFLGVI